MQAGGASPPAPAARTMVVAAFDQGAVSATPTGAGIAQLPWLLPGDTEPAIAPGGAHVAFASPRNGDLDVYVADARTGALTRISSSSGDDRSPAWSPDGKRIAWSSGGPADADVWVARADGTGARLLAGGPGAQTDPAWSPNGARVAFVSRSTGNEDIHTVSSRGGRRAVLLDDRRPVRAPSWHPSGRRLAVVIGAEPAGDLAIVQVPSGAVRVVATTRGTERRPEWLPDGTAVLVTVASRGVTSLWTMRPGGTAAAVPGTGGLREADVGRAVPLLAPGPELLLPDLDQQAPTGLEVTRTEDGRIRLGFDSSADNLGPGSLVIRGRRKPAEETMRADQVLESPSGATVSVTGVGTLRYEPHPPHRHWHLQPFVRFELRRASDLSFVGDDRKSGFCLIDRYGRSSKKVANVGKPRFTGDCETGSPRALSVEEGSSPGYVDRYPAFFHGQDIDITDVPAGEYVLVHVANPERGIRERWYANSSASVQIRLSPPRGRERLPEVTVVRSCPETERCPPGESR